MTGWVVFWTSIVIITLTATYMLYWFGIRKR